VLVGKTVADKLSPLRSLLGQIVRIDGVPFRVIGILEEKGESVNGRDQDNVVVAPISAAKARLLGGYYRENRDATAFVLIKAASEKQMNAVEESVRRVLRHRHGLNDGMPDDFSVRDPVAALSASKTASETMTVFLACIAAVSLLVGGISIMNIMLVSVAERSREIGIRMVVGADQADVRMQFLVEAAGVALVGGVIGVGFGLAASLILEALLGWRVDIEPWVCLGALAFAAAIGLASGMYPAYRASALDPMDAVRQ
jgi:putative ABC transport system permease protein